MGDTSDPKPQALHPVYTVTNIQNKVRVLDGVKVSYSSWVKLFQLHARGYDVLNHIDGSPAPAKTHADYSSWMKIDAVVLQWIYGTLSDDLLVRVLDNESTAFEAWNRVKGIFLNNKGSRAAALEHEFTNLSLKAMPSLEAYCQRLKELADQLADVDSPVNEQRRVLQLVRGLPPEYDTVASYLNQTLPSWENACSMLQLEMQRQNARETQVPTPLVAAAVTEPPVAPLAPRESNNRGSNSSQRRPNSNSNNRRDQARHGRPTSARGSGPSHPFSAQPTAHPTPYPYWPAPPYWAPPPCPFPTQGWSQPWQPRQASRTSSQARAGPSSAQVNLADCDLMEPTQLAATFQALSMEQPDDPWHLDSGATSHVTYDPGFQGWDDPEPSRQ